MTVSIWQDQSTETRPLSVDVAIIGAGIAGASTAWWLRESGLSVAVIDRGDVASGASGRNAGFVTCGSVEHFSRQAGAHGEQKAIDLWRMSQDNLALIEQHLIADGLECDFRRAGTWSLAGSEHELEELRKTAEHLQKLGVAVSVAGAEEVHGRLHAEGFFGGVLYHDDGEVHPAKLVRGILARSGAQVLTHHEVRGLEQRKDGMRVHTRLRTIDAGIVVLATNGYSADLHPWFADKIYPTRGQIIVTEPVAPFLPEPCYANFVLDYFRQLPDGRVLIGGFRQLAKETEVGTADVVQPAINAALEAFLRRHFPALAEARIDYRWSGTMGFSIDGLPLIGALPGRTDLYCVAGFTGHGIGWGFKAGQLLARLLMEGEAPPHVSTRRL
ncbi:MAG: FAD-binding oxidoreductase [Myxococcales bacterium]|nr:FAD-binding oxidoreductase [Myxococcales bacterium]